MKRIIAGIALATTLSGCASTIETGYRGVTLSWSKPTGEVKPEGLYWYAPFSGTEIVAMNVQVQSGSVPAEAVSSDLQKVNATVTLNYHLDPAHVVDVYDRLRTDYEARIIAPSIQQAVKATTSHFTADNLVVQRDKVQDQIDVALRRLLTPFGIVVDQVLITDFKFSDDFAKAIEAKVVSSQNLAQAKIEAETTITQANAAAHAQQAQKISLTPLMIQKLAIDKWDGHLPSVTGTTPFGNFGLSGFLPSEQKAQ